MKDAKKRAKGKGKKMAWSKNKKESCRWMAHLQKKYCIKGGVDIVGQVILWYLLFMYILQINAYSG
jgi:hypothetical protein